MQHFNFRRFLFIALASVVSGCHQVQMVPDGLRIVVPPGVRIDTTVSGRGASILTTFTNSSSDTVAVSLCNQTLDYLDRQNWKHVDMTGCAGYADPAWVVQPHDSLVVPIVKYDDPNMRILLRRGPLVSGVYRLAFDVYVRNLRIGRQSRRETITSGPFRIDIGSAASTSSTR